MHATIYGRGQMVIPARARKEARIGKGDILNVTPEGDGRLVLVRLEKPKPASRSKIRLVRTKAGHLALAGGKKITREDVSRALEDFP